MNPAQLVMDVEGFDTYAELLKFLDNGNFTDKAFSEEKIELSDAKPVYLPDGFKLINQGTSQVARSIRSYMSSRGFTIEELSNTVSDMLPLRDLFGDLIIPYYYKGTLRYYNARNVIGQGPRYNNPNKDITGLGKEFIIFNQDALDMYSSIFICEGAINALTMGDRAIATMGKAISAYQVNQLIKSPVNRFILY